MEFHEAFDRTLRDFGIKASSVAIVSGIPESDISRFRNGGQDMRGSKLSRLIRALPNTARNYFWLLFQAGEEIPPLSPNRAICSPSQKSGA